MKGLFKGFDFKVKYLWVLGSYVLWLLGFLALPIFCEFMGSMVGVKYFLALTLIFLENYTLYAHKMHKGGQIWVCAQLL